MLRDVILSPITKALPRKGLSPAEACGSLGCLTGGFEVCDPGMPHTRRLLKHETLSNPCP